MKFIHKICEVCGTKVNKLQKFSNIYFLKTGEKLQCPHCNTQYKTHKIISSIGSFYTWGGVWVIVLFLFIPTVWDIFESFFNKKFGGEIWLYGFILYSLIELLIMTILPLKKVIKENKKDK